jgi:hypothetical protein
MVATLKVAGIPATPIGRVVAGPPVVRAETKEGLQPFPTFERDELARVFG